MAKSVPFLIILLKYISTLFLFTSVYVVYVVYVVYDAD